LKPIEYKGYQILTHRIGDEYTYSIDGVKPMQSQYNRFASESQALDGAKRQADYFQTLL